MSTEGGSDPLAGVRRGDQAAIGALYRVLNPPLLRYLRHYAGPIAEDLASEVWLALAPRLATFSGDLSGLRALMFTIARRRMVDHHRHNARRVTAFAFVDEFDCAGDADTEELVVDRLTAQAAVEALVQELPDDQAEIVLLRVLADLDVEQVAAIVGKSKGAVRVAQHRALRRLRDTWATERSPVGGAFGAKRGPSGPSPEAT